MSESMKCPSCGKNLGKIVGKSAYLDSGSFVTGNDYQIVVKCDCGEVASLENKNGTIEGDYGKEKKQKPNKEGKDTNGSSDGGEGNSSDEGHGESGQDEGGKDGNSGGNPKDGEKGGSRTENSTGNRKWTVNASPTD